jgi:hypothetical protein
MPMRYFGLAAKVSGPLGDGRWAALPAAAAQAACRRRLLAWAWAGLWLGLAKPLLAAARRL